jgi:hypothetical protein
MLRCNGFLTMGKRSFPIAVLGIFNAIAPGFGEKPRAMIST